MNPYPGFTIRSYPAFRTARLYRVLVGQDALYFIRMKGLVSAADAGSGLSLDPMHVVFSIALRWFGSNVMESGRKQAESSDPDELVRSSKQHFKLAAGDVVRASLDPPALLGGHGLHYARWKVVAPGVKETFQIEDPDSLRSALELLPGVLGDRLTVKVDPPVGDLFRPRILG